MLWLISLPLNPIGIRVILIFYFFVFDDILFTDAEILINWDSICIRRIFIFVDFVVGLIHKSECSSKCNDTLVLYWEDHCSRIYLSLKQFHRLHENWCPQILVKLRTIWSLKLIWETIPLKIILYSPFMWNIKMWAYGQNGSYGILRMIFSAKCTLKIEFQHSLIYIPWSFLNTFNKPFYKFIDLLSTNFFKLLFVSFWFFCFDFFFVFFKCVVKEYVGLK